MRIANWLRHLADKLDPPKVEFEELVQRTVYDSEAILELLDESRPKVGETIFNCGDAGFEQNDAPPLVNISRGYL